MITSHSRISYDGRANKKKKLPLRKTTTVIRRDFRFDQTVFYTRVLVCVCTRRLPAAVSRDKTGRAVHVANNTIVDRAARTAQSPRGKSPITRTKSVRHDKDACSLRRRANVTWVFLFSPRRHSISPALRGETFDATRSKSRSPVDATCTLRTCLVVGAPDGHRPRTLTPRRSTEIRSYAAVLGPRREHCRRRRAHSERTRPAVVPDVGSPSGSGDGRPSPVGTKGARLVGHARGTGRGFDPASVACFIGAKSAFSRAGHNSNPLSNDFPSTVRRRIFENNIIYSSVYVLINRNNTNNACDFFLFSFYSNTFYKIVIFQVSVRFQLSAAREAAFIPIVQETRGDVVRRSRSDCFGGRKNRHWRSTHDFY